MPNVYTHWLVTKGRLPDLNVRRGYTPILLVPIAEADLKQLRRMVLEDAEKRATVFLSADPSEAERLKAIGSSYAAHHLSNLWVQQVRLATSAREADVVVETSTYWTLQGKKDVPPWQGPADGVIPREKPVTIRADDAEPWRLEVIDV